MNVGVYDGNDVISNRHVTESVGVEWGYTAVTTIVIKCDSVDVSRSSLSMTISQIITYCRYVTEINNEKCDMLEVVLVAQGTLYNRLLINISWVLLLWYVYCQDAYRQINAKLIFLTHAFSESFLCLYIFVYFPRFQNVI